MKHIKIFLRGLRKLWFVWAGIAYFFIPLVLGFSASQAILFYFSPLIFLLLSLIYQYGKEGR